VETLSLCINGKNLTCRPGITILEAALENGFSIPTLCHHPALKPHGACRLCLVEDADSGRLYASCVTPVSDNISVLTHSPRVISHRKTIVGMMMAAHPESCLVCSKGNDCNLRKIAGELGLGANHFDPMPKYSPLDQSNSFIFRDLTKCILCGKCIRACKELVVNGTMEYSARGFDSKPQTVFDTNLNGSDCTFCGTCVTVCPTGALVPSSSSFSGTPENRMESICGFCGTGCRLSLGITGNSITDVKPSETKDTVNGYTACVRGLFAQDYRESAGRLEYAMIKGPDGLTKTAVRDAITETAAALRSVREKFGPGSIGFYGSSKCGNEENFLFQKIAREGLGTPNIDNGGALYGRPAMERFDSMTSGLFRNQGFKNIAGAEAVVMVGTDASVTSPVLGYHVKRAAAGGAALVLFDRKKSAMARFSPLWLKPGFTVEAMDAYAGLIRMVRSTVEKGNRNDERTSKAADLLQGKRTAFVIGEDILENPGGGKVIDECLALSAALHGSLDQSGGMFLIARENNLVGSWDMGTVPGMLPGRVPATSPGLDIHGMIEAAEKGTLKAMYIMGENPLRNYPRPGVLMNALRNLSFLAVQDILETETSALAHVVLPGASSTEKSGSFTNTEGRVQAFSRAVEPPGEAMSDFSILCRLADCLGVKAGTLEDVRKEIGAAVPSYRCLADNKPSFMVEWEDCSKLTDFSEDLKNLRRYEPKPSESSHPYAAMISESHFHSGSGSRTTRSGRVKQAGTAAGASVSPTLALRHGFKEGQEVRLTSGSGCLVLSLSVDPGLEDKVVLVGRDYEDCGTAVLFGGSQECRVSIEGIR
jgi:formate dehydrogenase alpha subunit